MSAKHSFPAHWLDGSPRYPRTKAAWKDADVIIDRYVKGENIPGISKSYGVGPSPIISILKKNSIRIRPRAEYRIHKLNEDYFETIDSHEKAQILGFLYADGCVATNADSYRLSIIINEKDVKYLERIKTAFGYSGPIRRFKAQKKYNHVALVVHSRKLCEDLIKLGCMPRKTFKVKFPTSGQVPEEFVNSFVLGFFEGDGSIWTSKQKAITISLIGRKNMMKAIRDRWNLTNKICKGGTTYYFSFCRKPIVQSFLKDIYSNAAFVLERKYLRALPLLNS